MEHLRDAIHQRLRRWAQIGTPLDAYERELLAGLNRDLNFVHADLHARRSTRGLTPREEELWDIHSRGVPQVIAFLEWKFHSKQLQQQPRLCALLAGLLEGFSVTDAQRYADIFCPFGQNVFAV